MVAATGIQCGGTWYDHEMSFISSSLALPRIVVASSSIAGWLIIRSHADRRLTSSDAAEESRARGEGGMLAV
jgi:hypothetical protein